MQAPQVLLLGNSAGGAGAFYSVVDAHAGRQVAQGEVDMPVSQVWAASLLSLCSDKFGTCILQNELFWQGSGTCPSAAA